MPVEIYREKIEKLEIEERKLKKRSNVYLTVKLLSFVLALFFSYYFLSGGDVLYVMSAFFFLSLYVVFYAGDVKCQRRQELLRRMRLVCSKELACLEGDFSAFGAGDEYLDYRHEYAYDLDVFGESSLYQRINRTVTRRGGDRLAERLTHLQLGKEGIIARQGAVAELAALFEWRIKFMATPYIASKLDLLSKVVYEQRNGNWFIHSNAPYYLVLLTLLFLLAGVWGLLPWKFFGGMFIINFLTGCAFSKALNRANAGIDKLHKEYAGYVEVLQEIHRADFRSVELKRFQSQLFDENADSLDAFRRLSNLLNLFNQRGNVIVYVALQGCALFDVMLIKQFAQWSARYLPSMERWLDAISELDALVSLGSYAFNHPHNTYAEVLEETSPYVIQSVAVYHPFLSHEKAVPNDFSLKKSNVAIVTGANMAGKSTFLRTIGVNYILAANGMPVCAKSFKCALVTLFSSMRTTDNLSQDISYFNAELIRLEQLMRHVQSHSFTLIILDEILKGTNSKDKLEGSRVFLQVLAKCDMAALIATHDLELARLEQGNSATYKNYRFEIELAENIAYSYRIEEGIARNLNASYLLKNMLERLT